MFEKWLFYFNEILLFANNVDFYLFKDEKVLDAYDF